MNSNKINYRDLKEERIKSTPDNVKEANEALYKAKWNLPKAAKHCGMTLKEMKLIFYEYLKYNLPDYDNGIEGLVKFNQSNEKESN